MNHRRPGEPALLLVATIAISALLVVGLAPRLGIAQAVRGVRPPPVGAGGGAGYVQLPYQVSDNAGSVWMIQRPGWLQQNGGVPVYQQGANLQVNGQQFNGSANQARRDDKTGEIILDANNIPGLSVQRRVLFKLDEGYVRVIDVFRNTQSQDQSLNVQLTTSLNFGVQTAQFVDDAKQHNHVAWAAMTGNGRAALEVMASPLSKTLPNMIWAEGGNVLTTQWQLNVAVGKQVAIMHLHGTTASIDAAMELVKGFKDSRLISDLPPEVRKVIVNFRAGGTMVGDDRELLRGDLQDVVELRGGDQLKGTLKEDHWPLQTFYGNLDVPADQILGIISVGQFRPRQLLITKDGQILGGTLAKDSIGIELSSGQTTQIPVAQVSRIGYRKRSGDPEEWTLDQPMVMLRTGDRVAVAMPTESLDVATCYGTIKLSPEAIASIVFQSAENGVPDVRLVDGSHFAGLLLSGQLNLKLVKLTTAQPAAAGSSGAGNDSAGVTFPTATLAKVQLHVPPQEQTAATAADDDAAVMQLSNDDQLVGTLAGELKLDTAFDTITVQGQQIRALNRVPDSPSDVQLTLWDSTTLRGQLQRPQVDCALGSGLSVQVPVSLIESYTNPNPTPSQSMVEKIKQIVQDLAAQDWRQRDRAEQQLISMGPAVIGVLKQMSPSLSPEAQQRIDSIVKQLEKSNKPRPGSGPQSSIQLDSDDSVLLPEG